MTLPVRRSHQLQPGDGAESQLRAGDLIGAGMWTPLADLTETDDAYLVEIEVPGVNRKDLTVEVAGTELRG